MTFVGNDDRLPRAIIRNAADNMAQTYGHTSGSTEPTVDEVDPTARAKAVSKWRGTSDQPAAQV